MTIRPAVFEPHILTLDVPGFFQALMNRCHILRVRRGRRRAKKPNHRHRRLLSIRRERPRGRRAAEQPDELAAPHSITSSARASSVGGMAIPTALAVLKLMISSNLVGCAIGRSPGFSPFNTRPV